MKLADVYENREVVITGGGDDHPLHGHRATVVNIRRPLPDPPPVTYQEIANGYWEDDSRPPLRAEDWEEPFCWTEGKVLLFLGDKRTRRWAFPYVCVTPAQIEPADA